LRSIPSPQKDQESNPVRMGGRTHIEVAMLVMVLAMTWLSMPMPSSAQTTVKVGPCWERVDACIQRNVNQNTTNPEFDSRSPKFNPRKLLCCPLIKQIARADVPCFCSIGPILHDTPQGANLTRSLIFCDAIDSLSSFDTTCKGTCCSFFQVHHLWRPISAQQYS